MPSILGKKQDTKPKEMPDVWSSMQGSLPPKSGYGLRMYLISVSWYKRKLRQRHLQSQILSSCFHRRDLLFFTRKEINMIAHETYRDFPEPHQSQPQGTDWASRQKTLPDLESAGEAPKSRCGQRPAQGKNILGPAQERSEGRCGLTGRRLNYRSPGSILLDLDWSWWT